MLADAGYGDQPRFLDGLEIRGLPYLVGVASTTRFRLAQDVHSLFLDCYHISTLDATFWLVAGSVRRNKRLILLPELLASSAEQAGWILRESITWDKQKALPWTHHGQFRDITEQLFPGEQPAPPYQGQGRPRRARRLEERIPSREANALLEELLQDAWQAITWREGTKGNLTKEFTRVRVYRVGRRGKPLPTAGWLIGQRPLPGQQGESKYCFAWGLDSLSLQDQVVLAHNRWVIERFYQDAKGELGLDDYEGRFWTGLHRHVALVTMAHSFLSIRRNHGLPPQTDSTDGPRQFPSATSVAGFPPYRSPKFSCPKEVHT